ncbi:MAG: tRNA pseudouridine(55) synthase TruB [Phycisphaerae bacterium]|nr:tRNA pseudouridine(55) synthase TruB [Gemmatimonadaceae bacterium]
MNQTNSENHPLSDGVLLKDGMLLVDKPAGVSSHDVVGRARRAARTPRVGHAGTLDPFATGLLVLAVGNATRLLPYLDAEPKVYEARFRFGFETDSDDTTGAQTFSAPAPDWANLESVLAAFTGGLLQTPPAYSAKHVDGERAYKKARRGEAVELKAVEIVVHEWQVVDRTPDTLDVVITCRGGTYVRALARDVGRALNSAAHCETLRRARSGRCHLEQAVSSDALERGAIADGAVPLMSPLQALQDMTHVVITAELEADIRHGRSIAATDEGARSVLLRADSRIVGIANRTDDNRWQPRVVLPVGDGK